VVREAVRLKKEAFRDMISWRTPGSVAAERYDSGPPPLCSARLHHLLSWIKQLGVPGTGERVCFDDGLIKAAAPRGLVLLFKGEDGRSQGY
jgi:hypothetical protein